MKRYLLDTNVVIRFLTHDDPEQWPAAEALILDARRRDTTLILDPIVVGELTYALDLYFGKARAEIADALAAFIRSPGIETGNVGVLVDALERFRAKSVDFADAFLAARARAEGVPVASFDRDLDRFTDIKRHEPKR